MSRKQSEVDIMGSPTKKINFPAFNSIRSLYLVVVVLTLSFKTDVTKNKKRGNAFKIIKLFPVTIKENVKLNRFNMKNVHLSFAKIFYFITFWLP